ncbi:MAG: hypothetical protein A2297_10195 [Elusimicrobia bacterium RIFOXYB2_FULL_48_7]|nr:MAG: hypothetical protein A2297_10195 [Elusimicrobia bacterium RIFOXYB2_FULL_48_7]
MGEFFTAFFGAVGCDYVVFVFETQFYEFTDLLFVVYGENGFSVSGRGEWSLVFGLWSLVFGISFFASKDLDV